MYVPALFAESDPVAIGQFVDAHPLATLVLMADGRPHLDHVPFLRSAAVPGDRLERGGVLVAHVSKSNPTWRLAEGGVEAALVFTGASAYVSPSLYPSKQVTHEVVPTWNYVAVHLRGRLACSHDRDEKHRVVEALTRAMEAPRPQPWAVSEAPAAYIEKMLAGIVALRFELESVEAKRKASQNRTPADREGVIAGLGGDPATAEAAAYAARSAGEAIQR